VAAVQLDADTPGDGASSAEQSVATPRAVGPSADIGVIRRIWVAGQADALVRSSSLLVADYLVIGLIGGICSVIATHAWPPHDVGAVAAISGVLGLLVTASTSGIASTITRFLGSERNQRAFVLEANALGLAVGLTLVAIMCFVPAHFGVPLRDLRIDDIVAFGLFGAYVAGSAIVAVTDPAFLSRKEVSYTVAKDIISSLVRIGILVALIGTGGVGLFTALLLYVAIAASIDVALICWRLHNRDRNSHLMSFRMMRSRTRFAVGSHTAALVATIPGSILVTIIAAHFGPAEAAYVGIPVMVAAFLTIIPSKTAQALLAALAGESIDVARIASGALRLTYAATIPAAGLLALLAPDVLLIFGKRYSVHGVAVLRWTAASSIFYVFNYIGDTVLLARQKLIAYNVVNVGGTVAILACVIGAVVAGVSWIGPALFAGQLLYAAISVTTLLRYGKLADVLAAVRQLRWRLKVN
jgi:O-antigen/teichoic acid export membrane protein